MLEKRSALRSDDVHQLFRVFRRHDFLDVLKSDLRVGQSRLEVKNGHGVEQVDAILHGIPFCHQVPICNVCDDRRAGDESLLEAYSKELFPFRVLGLHHRLEVELEGVQVIFRNDSAQRRQEVLVISFFGIAGP